MQGPLNTLLERKPFSHLLSVPADSLREWQPALVVRFASGLMQFARHRGTLLKQPLGSSKNWVWLCHAAAASIVVL